jgi:hypothetical protein
MCVRCGTGRIAWCTDPTGHGDRSRQLAQQPRVMTKRDLLLALVEQEDASLDEPVLIHQNALGSDLYSFLQAVTVSISHGNDGAPPIGNLVLEMGDWANGG